MKKLCFIIPYFGHFSNYFPLFLKTCHANKNFDWLLLTDDDINYEYPINVHKVTMTFEEYKKLIQSKLNFDVNINNPYKLCDLKPMYGYILEEYITEYSYWGHCDTDILMGNLEEVLTDSFLNEYDKLFCLGHMTIYRNTPQNNRVFMSEHNGRYIYREVLATPEICWFDEEWNNDYNINRIFLGQGKRVFQKDLSLNISMSYNHFRCTRYVGTQNTTMAYGYEVEKNKKALYLWDNGQLYRLYMENGILKREDFLYMHMQKRVMRMDKSILQMDKFKIVPDEFLPLEVEKVSPSNFMKIKKTGYCRHTQRMLKNRIIQKIHKIRHTK